jgi:hypothetical protein
MVQRFSAEIIQAKLLLKPHEKGRPALLSRHLQCPNEAARKSPLEKRPDAIVSSRCAGCHLRQGSVGWLHEFGRTIGAVSPEQCWVRVQHLYQNSA